MRGCQGSNDRICHAGQISKNVMVPEANDPVAARIQEGGAWRIALAFRVLATIGFYDQTMFLTDEVADERSDRLLGSELRVLAHQPPAEHSAVGVGVGRHRGDADEGDPTHQHCYFE